MWWWIGAFVAWFVVNVVTEGWKSGTGIKMITLPPPFKLGTVNCYLIETGTGFVLIDTGSSNRRAELEAG